MIPRTPEPELMDEAEQARAYAEADFDEPNAAFIERVEAVLEAHPVPAEARVVDLGCGPADIAVRLAERHPAQEAVWGQPPTVLSWPPAATKTCGTEGAPSDCDTKPRK